MPSSSRLVAQIQSFIVGIKDALRGFPGDLAGLLARAQLAVDEKMEKVPPRARKPVLVLAVLALVALLVALIVASLPERDPYADWAIPPPVMQLPPQQDLIPPEELFLPDEPDFVPGVMLGREQRTEWTAEDAQPWWQNPLADGEEQWRTRIERMVDEIMESVP